jgi:hypothetical protein
MVNGTRGGGDALKMHGHAGKLPSTTSGYARSTSGNLAPPLETIAMATALGQRQILSRKFF